MYLHFSARSMAFLRAPCIRRWSSLALRQGNAANLPRVKVSRFLMVYILFELPGVVSFQLIKKNSFHSAPRNISFEEVTTASLWVNFTTPTGNPSIDRFEATVKGGTPAQLCSVKANQAPMRCQTGTLTAGTKYTIEGKACLPESSGCSASIEESVWTIPQRMSYYLLRPNCRYIEQSPHTCLTFKLHRV